MLSKMCILRLLLASIIISTASATGGLTFDRYAKPNHDFDRTRRGQDDDLSFIDQIGPQSAIDNEDNPLYEKAREAAHRIQSSLGLKNEANEFMICQALYSCYRSEVMTRRRYFTRQISGERLPFTCGQMEKMIQIQLLKWIIEESRVRSSFPAAIKKSLTFDSLLPSQLKRGLTFDAPLPKRLLTFDSLRGSSMGKEEEDEVKAEN